LNNLKNIYVTNMCYIIGVFTFITAVLIYSLVLRCLTPCLPIGDYLQWTGFRYDIFRL